MPHRFHEGEVSVQQRAGVAEIARRVGGSIHAEIPPRAAEFLAERSFAVLASRDARGRVWASIVEGAPGFCSAPDGKTIEIDAAPTAREALGEGLVVGAPLGVLAIDLSTRRRMRVNGRIERAASPIRIAVDEVFANCPKYVQRRDLERESVVGTSVGGPIESSSLSTAQACSIARADTFFIASGHGERGLDASHRGGAPGFVEVLDARRIAWPDFAGNSMFQTLGNLASDPRSGLVFADFETGDGLQLTGRARVDWDPVRASRAPGAERIVEFEIDAVCETRGALSLRSHAVEPSPFNP